MNQFKKAQVLLLPTEKASQLCIYNKELYYVIDGEFNLNRDKYNIYITSDDKIEKNDWCMIIDKSSSLYGEFEQHKGSHSRSDQWGKIIATTDRLSIDNTPRNAVGAIIGVEEILPQPSQQFIEQYIESYNKGDVIEDVLVEYESYHGTETSIAEINCISGDNSLNWKGEKRDYKLKINPKDNTINIKPIKDSWNREEVIEKMWLSYKASNTIFEDEIALKMEFNNWLTL